MLAMRPFFLGLILAALAAAKTFDAYFIDVEGGQATLMVAPSGEAMLVDTGWAGFNNRDTDRIAAAAKIAGVKQIDYLLITHYHADHVGGVPQLVAKLPVKHFVDHGPNNETGEAADALYSGYKSSWGSSAHMVVKPGDKIPVKGLDIVVVSANGELLSAPLPGAGQPNPLCGKDARRPEDKSENARSIGTLITYGKFRLIDLGDLTWNKEQDLVCPVNKIGTVDLYLTTHHGMDMSGPATIVHAMKARVAIMNNGATKGASKPAWEVVRSSPGLLDLWQLHYAVNGGADHNVNERFIANPDQAKDQGNYLKLSAESNGNFTVTNQRNGETKTYKR
jgi:beta-lactamase superfamily II metal-dependent hydrolase